MSAPAASDNLNGAAIVQFRIVLYGDQAILES